MILSLVATGGRGEDRVCFGPERCTLNFKTAKVGRKKVNWCAYDQARIREKEKVNGEKPCGRCSEQQTHKK